MDAFNDLGGRVARAWSHHRYDPDALPEIAATELDRAQLQKNVSYESILDWIGTTETLPYQMNIRGSFGEPPLTLFWHPQFYIEALFWASSTTSIHGHGFLGAFQVLAGTSLQSRFLFDAETATGKCRLGRLQQTDAELLRPGSVQMILDGEQFVHSVFHLGYPSVTIVVRTIGGAGRRQYEYYRPGVALAFGYEHSFDQLTSRLLQVARLEALLCSDRLLATARTIGKRCDLAACFRLLDLVQPIVCAQGRLEVAAGLISTLAATIGEDRASRLAEALTLDAELVPLTRARKSIAEPDLRLFLALLLTRQESEFVLPIVKEYTSLTNPGPVMAGWIRQLASKGVLDVPADDGTHQLVSTWLSAGRDAAMREAHGSTNAAESTKRAKRVEANRFLGPLLRTSTGDRPVHSGQ